MRRGSCQGATRLVPHKSYKGKGGTYIRCGGGQESEGNTGWTNSREGHGVLCSFRIARRTDNPAPRGVKGWMKDLKGRIGAIGGKKEKFIVGKGEMALGKKSKVGEGWGEEGGSLEPRSKAITNRNRGGGTRIFGNHRTKKVVIDKLKKRQWLGLKDVSVVTATCQKRSADCVRQ